MNLTIPEVILKVQDIDQRLIELGNELEEQDIIMNDPNSTEDVIEEATEKFMKIIGEGGALTVERMDLQYYPTIYASRMELLNELKNSMLIPKPKFNIGDHINTIVENEHFIIDDCKYSVLDKEWYYMCCDYYTDYHYTENEIYLIKSKESK